MTLTATWTRLRTTALPPVSSHTIAIINSTLYLFSGETQPRVPIPSETHVLPLDGTPQSTLARASTGAPPPRVGAAAAPWNTKIYLFGGRGGKAMDPLDERGRVWVFDPEQENWGALDAAEGEVPAPRSYHCAAVAEGVLYVHAGCPASGRLRDLWAFRIDDRRWTRLEDAPGDERGGTSIAAAAGKLWRWGGFNGTRELGGGVDVYDIARGKWRTLPPTVPQPEPRSVTNLTSLVHPTSGKQYLVVLFGERDPSSLGHAGAGKFWDDVWAFDVEAGAWELVEIGEGEQPVPRGWIATAAYGRGVLVCGGLEQENRRLADAWVLEF